MPRGDRVAYDLDRGRLWVVCRSCRHWSLVPMEERWEVLEELDELVGGGEGKRSRGARAAKLLSRTDHAVLFKVASLEIVRVGECGPTEEAWWRYGQQMDAPSGGGSAAGAKVNAKLPTPPRKLKSTGVVWRGTENCPVCGYLFTEIPFSDGRILIIRPGAGEGASHEGMSLSRRCPKCRDSERGGLHLKGVEAELVLTRLLAYEHHTGAPYDRVQTAARMAEDPDGPATLVRILTRHGQPLGDLPPVGRLALEMVTNAAREQTLLRLRLGELTFRWRQEEELAAVIDEELTWVPLWDRFKKILWGDR